MSNLTSASEQSYQGEPAIVLTYAKQEAIVLPAIGANLIAYRDHEKGYRFLREPKENEMDAFRANPGVNGIPVLFPPNRYEDGTFTWNGKTYTFPINEVETHNHLHGFLHTIPWNVDVYEANEQSSSVLLSVSVDEHHDVYKYFPHQFTVKLKYTLSVDGLLQQIQIRNDGAEDMPVMLAFHTALNAPFATDSTSEDMSFKATIGKRYQMTERMLPTGEFQPLSAWEKQFQTDGANPSGEEADNHYTAVPQRGRNFTEITDTRLGVTLVYDVGTAYKHWMIWNNIACGEFICPEPQTNLVNAPNVDLPDDEKGLFRLEQGEIWEESSRLYTIQK
ncbi:aldose 1-epimerase [Paenibacillus nicotianae]|uniref:Aldose 1-epimerase n=1 Tax=Paenibacillus nicotianae TaxID=1526551 RepID=A0ABW4UWH1_9BACL